MATIRDVARLAGVSISTVSLTLNAPDRVSSETRRRVDEAARAVGYAANPIAQSLKRGRSQLIGIVVSDITNPFFGALLREVEQAALDRDHLVVVNDTAGNDQVEQMIVRLMDMQRVAGLILSSCVPRIGPAPHIADFRMPLVMFDHRLDGVDRDFVGTDNVLAGAMLTEHLVRLGHRRIALIGGTEGLFTAQKRRQGYEETLRANGLTIDPRLILDGRYDGMGGYQAAMRLLTMTEGRPTAIVAASNVMAIGALQACNDLSIACPDQVSLAGIDDVPWSAVIRPRITMAVQPVAEMGRAAIRLLFDRIAAGDGPPARDAIMPPRLIIGESTRPPPAGSAA